MLGCSSRATTRLALETGQEAGISGEGWVQDFDGHVAIERGVVSPEDGGHSALPELFHNAVWADQFTNG
jgi:hypothetical protein